MDHEDRLGAAMDHAAYLIDPPVGAVFAKRRNRSMASGIEGYGSNARSYGSHKTG